MSWQSHLYSSEVAFVSSLNIGKLYEVFDVQGTICRMEDCRLSTSSCNSLFSVLSWSRSLRVEANFCVIILSLSFVSSNSFLRFSLEVLVGKVPALDLEFRVLGEKLGLPGGYCYC
jgi:hypothetical protein